MRVTIISSASVKQKQYLDIAKEVASFLARKKWDLVVGGVSGSMMRIVYDEFNQNHCHILCHTMSCYQNDLICPNTILHQQTFDRLKGIYNQTDMVIVLPGGTGSLTELFGILEEIRTQDQKKKIILLNVNHFYTPILNFLDELIEQGFNQKEIKDYLVVVDTIEDLKEKVGKQYE